MRQLAKQLHLVIIRDLLLTLTGASSAEQSQQRWQLRRKAHLPFVSIRFGSRTMKQLNRLHNTSSSTSLDCPRTITRLGLTSSTCSDSAVPRVVTQRLLTRLPRACRTVGHTLVSGPLRTSPFRGASTSSGRSARRHSAGRVYFTRTPRIGWSPHHHSTAPGLVNRLVTSSPLGNPATQFLQSHK